MYEQLYNDFTTKLLPQVQEGLVLTKDYFLDLFARYIKYLIVVDSISLLISVLTVILSLTIGWKLRKWAEKEIEDINPAPFFLYLVLSFVAITGFIGAASNTFNLAKDIYIPEVRIYEELQKYKNANH